MNSRTPLVQDWGYGLEGGVRPQLAPLPPWDTHLSQVTLMATSLHTHASCHHIFLGKGVRIGNRVEHLAAASAVLDRSPRHVQAI